jgi:hypothetical protein
MMQERWLSHRTSRTSRIEHFSRLSSFECCTGTARTDMRDFSLSSETL